MASMDVERSSPAPPSCRQAGLKTVEKLQRIRCSMRRALPAVCIVAAIVFSAARDALPTVPSSWLSVEDVPPSNTDQFLGGLLTAEFDSHSCRSRYELASYHDKKKKKKKKKHQSHKPSSYLLAKLRSHEALQKQCGPGTAPYRAAIRQLKSGNGTVVAVDSEDCRYLVPISYRGLGNRMLSTASAFLFAVLTERTLLVQHDVAALFCEPFPGTTWLLPSSNWSGGGFPLGDQLEHYGIDSKESLGNMLKTSDGGRLPPPPPYVYLHLEGGYGFYDKLFYCDEQQRFIHGVPWLLMRTDSYLVPGLFLIPSFRDELERMFPREKDAAFHHLGRYLFHPVNDVWQAVKTYYEAHLAGAGQRVGIQIRVFTQNEPLQKILDQVLSCVRRSIQMNNDASVLVTSLSSWYYERIKAELEHGGIRVRVHQPTHEGEQKFRDASHDRKALSEMYLLSTCDVLVTTGFSTFGYVAQGLGGIRPWIMPATPFWANETGVVPDPPCMRAMSVEPCFHSPSCYDCAARKDVDVGKVVPYIQRCEDAKWGIKIANQSMPTGTVWRSCERE